MNDDGIAIALELYTTQVAMSNSLCRKQKRQRSTCTGLQLSAEATSIRCLYDLIVRFGRLP